MWSSPLFWRTFTVYTVLTLLAVGAFTSVIANRLQRAATERVQLRLLDLALVLKNDVLPALRDGPTEEFRRWVQITGRQHRVRLSVISGDGAVVAVSQGDPEIVPNQLDADDVRVALEKSEGVALGTDPRTGESELRVATRIGSPVRPLGFVRASLPSSVVDAEVGSVQRWIWLTAVALTVLGLASTYLVLRRIVLPIQRLTHAAREMASGNVEQNVVVDSHDELRTLAESFNATSRELAERIQLLRRKTADVEEESERLETVLGAMIEGVVAIDADEKIIFANAAARRMLGRKEGNLVGRPIWEAVFNADVQAVVRRGLSSGEDDVPRDFVELQLSQPDSRVAVVTRRLPGEPSPGIVLLMHDVTELRRLENVRTEFVQNVSHELKTPLALIRMNTETLLDWALDDPDENRTLLNNVLEQCDGLNNLIQDLLQLARIDSDRDAFDLRPVPVDDVVEATVEEFVPMATAKGITLATDPAPANVTVQADDGGLATIVKNLLSNALHYTPADGRILVRWRTDGDTAVIEVEDSGIGIAPEDQKRIFERFFRVDKARSRDEGGTGLGLAIVKHLTQQFSGAVSVASEVDAGSMFTVRLPLS